MQSMPDMSELMKLAASPAGQKLLAMVRSSNMDLERIAAMAAAGNLDAAKRSISEALSSEDARKLLKQMEDSL